MTLKDSVLYSVRNSVCGFVWFSACNSVWNSVYDSILEPVLAVTSPAVHAVYDNINYLIKSYDT